MNSPYFETLRKSIEANRKSCLLRNVNSEEKFLEIKEAAKSLRGKVIRRYAEFEIENFDVEVLWRR